MSRVGIAASMLREGKAAEQVAKAVGLPLREVEQLGREVSARLTTEGRALPVKSALVKFLDKQASKPKRPGARKGTPHLRWTPELDAQFARDYPNMSSEDLTAKYGRTSTALSQRASALGLKKARGYVTEIRRSRALANPSGSKMINKLREASRLLKARDHIGALEAIESAIKIHQGESPCYPPSQSNAL